MVADFEVQLSSELEFRQSSQKQIKSLTEQLNLKSIETEDLRRKNDTNLNLKDSKENPSSQFSTNDLNSGFSEANLSISDLVQELELVVSERDKLAERIISTEENLDKIVAERVVSEKEKNKILEKKLEMMQLKLNDYNARFELLDSEKSDFVSQIDELNHWKSVYEAGHGLKELSRNQKRLIDANRLLELRIGKMNADMGLVLENNDMLTQAFERLKVDCGKDAAFMYPEYELRQEVLSEKARLTSQFYELENQVATLESENIQLRIALKNQAGLLGEKGIEFSSNNTEMTGALIDNRSMDLIRENKRLKDDLKVLELQLLRYERDTISTGSPTIAHTDANNSNVGSMLNQSDLISLRDDMQKLFDYVRSKSSTVSQNDNDGKLSENISTILLKHNESLIKEIRELQRNQNKLQQSHKLLMAQQNMQQENNLQNNNSTEKIIDRLDESKENISNLKVDGNITSVPLVSSSYKLPGVAALHSNRKSAISSSVFSEIHSTQIPKSSVYTTPKSHNQDVIASNPSTLHGNKLLNKNVSQMNLPAEEWAQEVCDVNAQLVECLEQLYEREQELEEQRHIISSFEDHLISVKQQTTVLYHDHISKVSSYDRREREYLNDLKRLRNENDDMKLKLSRFNELIELKKQNDFSLETNENKLNELYRKISVYEVNENILSRKFVSLSENLAAEQEVRRKLEFDLADMEGTLKKRILNLEQYKATAGSRLASLQSKLDVSVPQSDYLLLQNELEYLREEHLNTLRREVDARVQALMSHENLQELRTLKLTMIDKESKLCESIESVEKLNKELLHQKQLTSSALEAMNSSDEYKLIISELATYRGETSKLQVQLNDSDRKYNLLLQHVEVLTDDLNKAESKFVEQDKRLEEFAERESSARKELSDYKSFYDNGLSKEEYDKLKSSYDKILKELEDSKLECSRLQDIAEIASKQAQALGFFKQDYIDTIQELQAHCTRLESRTDDDILIGKLQRQLMSTKTSYKAFVRKYQLLQGNMKQRELAIRLLETRLDRREESVFKLQEDHRTDIVALKKAIRSVSNISIAADNNEINNTSHNENMSISDQNIKKKSKYLNKLEKKLSSEISYITDKNTSRNLSEQLKLLSKKVNYLSNLTEQAITVKLLKEKESQDLMGQIEDLINEKEILQQRCLDLDLINKDLSQSVNSLNTISGNDLMVGNMISGNRQNTIAQRLIALSEEVRVCKLNNLQQQRHILLLRQEKSHLEHVIAEIETNIESLEELKVQSEINNYAFNNVNGFKNPQFNLGVGRDGLEQKFNQNNLEKADEDYSNAFFDKFTIYADKAESDKRETNEDLMFKLEKLNQLLNVANRTASKYKLQIDQLQSNLLQNTTSIEDKDRQLQYYEKIMTKHGFPILSGNQTVKIDDTELKNRVSGHKLSYSEQEQLQQAASATIHSLKSLIDEKNKIIEKYLDKINDLQMQVRQNPHSQRTQADTNAEMLLERLKHEDGNIPIQRRSTLSLDPQNSSIEEVKIMNQKLLQQLDEADKILMDKSALITQLEDKVSMYLNQKERAEVRCGESIQEMELMKKDMMKLVQQLQLSDERIQHSVYNNTSSLRGTKNVSITGLPVPPTPSNVTVTAPFGPKSDNSEELMVKYEKKVKDLTKMLKSKDEKIKEYREIVVRLKEEFLKSEEENTELLSKYKNVTSGKGVSSIGFEKDDVTIVSKEEMKQLQNQVTILRNGLQQAKDDLEKARVNREKQQKVRQASVVNQQKVVDDLRKLETQYQALQTNYSTLEKINEKFKKDLEDSKRKEFLLRNKLKEVVESQNTAVNEFGLIGEKKIPIQSLERELELLKVQNKALREGSTIVNPKLADIENIQATGNDAGIINSNCEINF